MTERGGHRTRVSARDESEASDVSCTLIGPDIATSTRRRPPAATPARRGQVAFDVRHLGGRAAEGAELDSLGLTSVDRLTDAAMSPAIHDDTALAVPSAVSGTHATALPRRIASRNIVTHTMLAVRGEIDDIAAYPCPSPSAYQD